MRPELEAQAHRMDAAHYWKGFPVTAYWDQPREVVGTVLALADTKTADGRIPRLTIQQRDGVVVVLNVAQERLLAALVEAAPAVGDKVRVRYHGETKPPGGGRATKRFTVEVKRAGDPAPAPAEGGPE